MKKTLALMVLIVVPTLAFAQGTVVFKNDETGLVRQYLSITDPTLISVPVGGGHVELLAAPSGTPFTPFISLGGVPYYPSLEGWLAANPGWADIATAGLQPVAGRFNGGTGGPFSGTVYASSNVILTILAPPSITQPPQSQTAYEGFTVDFQVSATGSLPLGYQWFSPA